jgi:hypothetical protein
LLDLYMSTHQIGARRTHDAVSCKLVILCFFNQLAHFHGCGTLDSVSPTSLLIRQQIQYACL